MEYLLYFLAGSFAGIMAGLLGIGGGMVIVPIFSVVFPHYLAVSANSVMQLSSGTALCIMIFTTQASVRAHVNYRDIPWDICRQMVLFIIMGTILGAAIADFLPTVVIKKVFGIFLLLMVFEMLVTHRLAALQFKPKAWMNRIAGMVIGAMSGFLGVGGGAMAYPYLSRSKIPMRRIVALSSMCSLVIAIVGTLTVFVTGYDNNYHLPLTTGYVYWPAVFAAALPSAIFARIAAKWTYRLPLRYLKRFFMVFLMVTACHMLVI